MWSHFAVAELPLGHTPLQLFMYSLPLCIWAVMPPVRHASCHPTKIDAGLDFCCLFVSPGYWARHDFRKCSMQHADRHWSNLPMPDCTSTRIVSHDTCALCGEDTWSEVSFQPIGVSVLRDKECGTILVRDFGLVRVSCSMLFFVRLTCQAGCPPAMAPLPMRHGLIGTKYTAVHMSFMGCFRP